MRRAVVPVLAILLGASCGHGEQAHEAVHEAIREAVHESTPSTEAAVDALEIRNARRPAEDLLTGGQLTEEQMTALHELGYRTFINLRPTDEDGTGWEEEFAEAEGIDFARLPVTRAAGTTVENAELLADMLEEAGDDPVVVYCASGNRVGALLALKSHFVDGESPENALAFGKEAGVTRLEPKVREMLGLAEAEPSD